MFTDMFDAIDEGQAPRETFYDGYVVNAIIDAAYASIADRAWKKIELPIWRGQESTSQDAPSRGYDADHVLIKEELMPDGTTKLILRHKQTGRIVQQTG
jgi:hypothetical protein